MFCVCVSRFMDNLQTEVLEVEFNEFSHGMTTIHEQDFARILLRYTTLTKQAHSQYLDRLAQRIPHSQVYIWSFHPSSCPHDETSTFTVP